MNTRGLLPRARGVAAMATLVVGSTALPAAGSSHIVDVVWSEAGRFEHSAMVPAGRFIELCGKLAAGDRIRWAFDAAVPMDFNIHYHVSKETVFPAKQGQVVIGGELLQVGVTEHHCWMWTNRSANAALLRVMLQR